MRAVIRRMRDLEIAVRGRLGLDDHAKVFDAIYRDDTWRGGSGPGSTIANTGPYRDFIASFLRTHAITSVVDIGCGDWQSSHLIDWGDASYLGTDVSKIALERARRYAGPKVTFQQLDATREDVPRADLLLAKDVLQHWSNSDIRGFLPKLSGYRFALITNGFPEKKARFINTDIRPGKGRPVELSAPPFNVPGSDVFTFDADEPKRVFLWTRQD
jgi:SAM-dependent methyltransferase